jgi:hypothetical protein
VAGMDERGRGQVSVKSNTTEQLRPRLLWAEKVYEALANEVVKELSLLKKNNTIRR